LFYATQTGNGDLPGHPESQAGERSVSRARSQKKSRDNFVPLEFVLFVNDPKLMTEAYHRYLEARIRETEPFPGLPVILTLRPRAGNIGRR
jgi:predicted GTPase